MRRRDVPKALLASATQSALVAQRAEAETCKQPCHPRTHAEVIAGVTPTHQGYIEGDLRRYGAKGDGTTDDSVAWQAAVNVGIARIAKGFTFRILTGAARTGRILVYGEGQSSKLLCDSAVLTVTSGTDSTVDNFSMENLTAPWIITRTAAAWGADISGTLQRSNSVAGYQPTVNDTDIWPSLSAAQQNQQIGPSIVFKGNASGIEVSCIYGRFVILNIQDAVRSTVRDCVIRGGKGVWGGIIFDNGTNGNQAGGYNKAVNNDVQYASFSGIAFLNNHDGQARGNICCLNGESGIKTVQGEGRRCFRMQISDNHCHQNYYDGVDGCASYPPDDTPATYHNILGNCCHGNGGDGVNTDGRYNQIVGNHLYFNNRFGIWNLGSLQTITANFCIDNNQARNPGFHEIIGGHSPTYPNAVVGNCIWMGPGANSSAIYCDSASANFVSGNFATGGSFFFGNAGAAKASVDLNNIDDSRGALTDQCFCLYMVNTAGKLQHCIYEDKGGGGNGHFSSRINNATNALTDTPAGSDADTAFAAGGKVGSADAHYFIFDTHAQVGANALMVAVLVNNSTGTAVNADVVFLPCNVNGVVRTRLVMQFRNATSDAPFALNTRNIPSAKYLRVQFYGKLA
ncbi:MAG: hypothetical protein JWM63_4664 [Gammaproteobacteria bacterium]|nr:hypothetical protein [Gammaproteobacteria bacterium]